MWYSIKIYLETSQLIFDGYFNVNNQNKIVGFYNNISFSNILINEIATFTNTTGSHNNTQSNNLFINMGFPVGGTTISSIPYLDATYNSTEWALWTGSNGRSRLSYYSNGQWYDLPNTFINSFVIEQNEPVPNITNSYELNDFLNSDLETGRLINNIEINNDIISQLNIKKLITNNDIYFIKI